MTTLSIGVSKYLEGEESLATGRIVDIDQGLTQAVRVPVGRGRFIQVDVEPGRYLVQVDMPFGMPLSRSINVAAGEPMRRVELEGPHSDHEWLSWSNFSTGAGALGSTPRRLDFSPALEAERVANHQIELWVGLHRVPIGSGSRQMTLDGVDFDVKIDSDWPNLVARIFTLSNAPDMGQVPRTFVVARTGAERKFMTVPVPWINYQAQGDPRRAVDVLISETLFDPDAERDVPPPARLAVTVRDPLFAAVFGYLAGGNPAAALRVGGDLRNVALRMIAEKVMNPYAASGAAYLLLRSESNTGADGLPQQWLMNLANWFPWLPDGMVLSGWNLLRTVGETAEARNCLLTATKRGIPVYTEGVRLLIQGLSMLTRDRNPELESALRRAREYGARVDPAAPFTIGPAELLDLR